MKQKDADRPCKTGRFLFHATPADRLASIQASGLDPRMENALDRIPAPGVYLALQIRQIFSAIPLATL